MLPPFLSLNIISLYFGGVVYDPTSLPIKDMYKPIIFLSEKTANGLHALGKSLGLLLGTWFLRTTRRKSYGSSIPFLRTNACVHAHTCTHAHHHKNGLSTYKVEKIKPNVFSYFILAAFQVFKFLAYILLI